MPDAPHTFPRPNALHWVAFHVVMALPGGWNGPPWSWLEDWLLPHAAIYDIAEWRRRP